MTKTRYKILGLILALALAVTMLLGGGLLSAFGSGVDSTTPAISFSVPSRVFYRDSRGFNLGTGSVVITTPIGTELPAITGNAQHIFNQVGVHTLNFHASNDGTGNVVYSTTILVELDGDFEMRVDNNGARIPTVINQGGEFVIPNASMFVRTEGEDEFVRYMANATTAGYEVEIRVSTIDGSNNGWTTITSDAAVTDGWATHSFNRIGSYTVRYIVTLLDGEYTQFVQDFTVRVQSASFTNDAPPSLTVVGVPQTANINTRVNLPIATASDNYQDNVLVRVSVVHVDGNTETPVEVATIDRRTGFAVGTTGEEVQFDNVWNMSFYPTEMGIHRVTYTAENPFGLTNRDPRVFTIRVEDRMAPILLNYDESGIPSTWGKQMERRDPAATINTPVADAGIEVPATDMYINFPFPEFVDNSGDMGRVSFEVRDTTNNIRVLYFNDITTPEGRTFTPSTTNATNGLYNTAVTFYETAGLDFNFHNYVNTLESAVSNTWGDENIGRVLSAGNFDGLGRYTFQFQARDAVGIVTTRTFEITLVDFFSDVLAPTISGLDDDIRPIRIYEGMRNLTVPTAFVNDTQASRLRVSYRVSASNDINFNSANYITVENSENLIVDDQGSEIWLRNRRHRDWVDSPSVTAAQVADLSMDIVGFSYLVFEITATDYVGNSTTETQAVRFVVDRLIPATTFTGITSNISGFTSVNISADGRYNIGGFTINGVNADFRNFVGFELALTDSQDRTVAIESLDTFFNGTQIVVNNMRVSLNNDDYVLAIRAFDISGRSESISVRFNITTGAVDAGGGYTATSFGPIGTTGGVRHTYVLRNERGVPASINNAQMVRRIENATHFSLMGSEFTAFTVGSFRFNEGYQMPGNTIRDNVTMPAASYTFQVTDDDANMQINVHGGMPVHAPRAIGDREAAANAGSWVQLPVVSGHNGFESANISVEVINPNNVYLRARDALDSTTLLHRIAPGQYAFWPNVNGEYRVRFTATVGSSDLDSETFVIRVGNLVPVAFTVNETEAALQSRVSFNGEFQFATITAIDFSEHLAEFNLENDDITVTKRLFAPGNFTTPVMQISDTGLLSGGSTTETTTSDLPDGFVLRDSGTYRVEYVTEDNNGNRYIIRHEFSVTPESGRTPVPVTVIATVLVIVVSLGIAAVILYMMRFRKKKIKA